MGKFLDINGVKYLWSKIKESFIQRGGVNTDDIVDAAITNEKIADGSINGAKFSPGLVAYMGQQLSYFKQVVVVYGEDPSTAIKSFTQRDYKTALYIKLKNGLLVPANTNGETASSLYSYGNTVRKVLFDGTNWSDVEIQNDIIDTDHIKDGAVTNDKLDANIKSSIVGALRYDILQNLEIDNSEIVKKNIRFTDSHGNMYFSKQDAEKAYYPNPVDYNGYPTNSIFGSGCDNNAFQYNTCTGNIFGNDCRMNDFNGNNCSYNIIGNNCQGNMFGTNVANNRIGNSVINCSFGNYMKFCEIGSGVKNVKIVTPTTADTFTPLKNILVFGLCGYSADNPLIVDLSDKKYLNQDRTLIVTTKNHNGGITKAEDLVMYYADEVAHETLTNTEIDTIFN